MAFPIELHEAAETELWEAIDWYDSQKENLGKEFARELERIVKSISQSPKAFAKVEGDARKAVLRRFPDVLIFITKDDIVTILAIFHTSRSPKQWILRQ
ncbi:MAG: type II toxin-antitoxin system RelE/ParE family toxin [Saprospiraceae bacterium]